MIVSIWILPLRAWYVAKVMTEKPSNGTILVYTITYALHLYKEMCAYIWYTYPIDINTNAFVCVLCPYSSVHREIARLPVLIINKRASTFAQRFWLSWIFSVGYHILIYYEREIHNTAHTCTHTPIERPSVFHYFTHAIQFFDELH